MNTNSDRVRIAIQKSGKLNADSLQFLNTCYGDIAPNSSALLYQCKNDPIDILFVRDDDIPRLVSSGACAFGIVGTNVLQEFLLRKDAQKDQELNVARTLDFGFCRLSIALPKQIEYQNRNGLQGLRIASTYPNLLRQFLDQNQINAKIEVLQGSVEIAPKMGIADAVCDLVSTGKTLAENDLIEVEKIFESQAVLIESKTQTEKAARLLQTKSRMASC